MFPKNYKDKIVPTVENNIMYKTTFDFLKNKYDNKLLKIPKLQREIDLDKCNEIAEKIKQNRNWLLRLSNIELVQIKDTTTTYIIDGQHRFNALMLLSEEIDVADIEMYVKFTIITDEVEMQELFIDLNQNSTINQVYLNFGDEFTKVSLIKIHNYIKQYKKLYREKKVKGKGNHKLHVEELVNMITTDVMVGIEKPNNMELHDFFIQRMTECNEQIKNALTNIPLEIDRSRYIKETDYEASMEAEWFLCYDNINILPFLLGTEKLHISAIKK